MCIAVPTHFTLLTTLVCQQNIDTFRYPAINTTALTSYVAAGLARDIPRTDNTGFTFEASWGTKKMNAYLRECLPIAFRYLGTINPHVLTIGDEPDDSGITRFEYSWPYILVKKTRMRYEILDNTHPTGADFIAFLPGDTHTSFRSRTMFLSE